MKIDLRAALAALALPGAIACASPIRVVQLETLDSEARGVRYLLKRPSYTLGLQYRDPGEDASGKPKPWACRFDLVVVTKLDQRRYYEVRRPAWYVLPLHALSNTKVSVVLDDDGALASAALEEEDQALEFVQAVAALAVKALGVEAVPPDEPTRCLPTKTDEGFAAYEARRKALEEEIAALRQARATLLADLAGGGPNRPTPALRGLAAVDARLEAVGRQLVTHYLPVHEDEFQLRVGNEVFGKGGDAAPLQVKLEPIALTGDPS